MLEMHQSTPMAFAFRARTGDPWVEACPPAGRLCDKQIVLETGPLRPHQSLGLHAPTSIDAMPSTGDSTLIPTPPMELADTQLFIQSDTWHTHWPTCPRMPRMRTSRCNLSSAAARWPELPRLSTVCHHCLCDTGPSPATLKRHSTKRALRTLIYAASLPSGCGHWDGTVVA